MLQRPEKASTPQYGSSYEGNYGRTTSILIDGSQFLNKTATGIGTYGRALAAALQSLSCNVGVLYGRRARWHKRDSGLALAAQVFGNTPPPRRWSHLLSDAPFIFRALLGCRSNIRPITVPVRGVELSTIEPRLPPCHQVWNADGIFDRAFRLFSMKEQFLQLLPPEGVTVAHWTGPIAIKANGIPNIYTLHDLIPLQFPHFVLDRGGQSVKLHEAIAREADLIITVSEASKRIIVELLGVPDDRVIVTYQAAPPTPKIPQEDAERLVEVVYGTKPGQYALFLGAIEPKKNLKRLIESFLLACGNISLLIAGPLGWLYEDDLALLDTIAQVHESNMSLLGRKTLPPVRRLGYLPRRHIAALLQCARFFVFPSTYEGFGLPVLEAMQFGVPVLTSNTSSLPEVVGDAAVLVDPLDVSALAREIKRLTQDDDLRAELRQRGPQQAAKFGVEIYRQRLAAAYATVGVRVGGTDSA